MFFLSPSLSFSYFHFLSLTRLLSSLFLDHIFFYLLITTFSLPLSITFPLALSHIISLVPFLSLSLCHLFSLSFDHLFSLSLSLGHLFSLLHDHFFFLVLYSFFHSFTHSHLPHPITAQIPYQPEHYSVSFGFTILCCHVTVLTVISRKASSVCQKQVLMTNPSTETWQM